MDICSKLGVVIHVLTILMVDGEGWLLHADQLPADDRLIPGVGNGHLATQVYSDTIYMNNVYNGYTSSSHRARIPSTAAIQLSGDFTDYNYTLDMRRGVFVSDFVSDTYRVEQMIYAHRSRNRVIVNQLRVTRLSGSPSQDIIINLQLNKGAASEDIDLITSTYNDTVLYTTGPVREPETETSGMPVVHQYWTEVPPSVTLRASEANHTWRYLTSISIDQSDAFNAFESANNVGAQELFQEHSDSWEAIWSAGDVTVVGDEGDLELQETFRAALFHIMISTPDYPDGINSFGGLSPGGLARGGKINNESSAYNDYLGHVFWDMDTWILPAVLMFHPEKALLMIQARYRVINATKDRATEGGNQGIRYPWEQGYTGYEVCPWDDASLYQIHVTADVSYAIRQYLYSTRDSGFIVDDGGKKMVMEIARFWQSRVTLEDSSKGYEIQDVMGPDEYVSNVNNSVFTNFNAKLSLSLPQYLLDTMEIPFTPEELEEMSIFNEISDNMYIPFDEELQFHPQYDGFDHTNSTIKQSDVVLLGYPLMMNMTREVRRNDLDIYEEITDEYGPDTGTWSMHTVGWLELDDLTRAEETFRYMFRNINGPFKIFSEKPDNSPDGMRATNFITLAGGMLQAVIFGYGGVRVRGSQLDMKPYLLPNTTSWAISGFRYRGSSLNFDFQDLTTTVVVTYQDIGAEPLIVLTPGDEGGRHPLEVGVPLVLSRDVIAGDVITIVTLSDEPGVNMSEGYV